jgi:nitrite reductase/ring-hydroxylating ferredoxin subunit
MKEKKYNWHKLADNTAEINFSSNGMTELKIAERTICVVFQNDTLLACTQKCPHAGGILADGFVDAAGNIVCPLHRYRFSLHNGRNISGEGYFLKTFPVEKRKEGIFIGFEENSLLNWLG